MRYLFMLPILFVIVLTQHKLKPLWNVMREQAWTWVLWSFVGFGLFYAPLCFASAYSPGWLIAGTWQITIISGSLLVPLFSEIVQTENGPLKVRGKIPIQGLMMSLVILLGIILMQIEQSQSISAQDFLFGIMLDMILHSYSTHDIKILPRMMPKKTDHV
ncbi:hypothetical protein ABH897_000106 [Paenibacillus sp. RC73]